MRHTAHTIHIKRRSSSNTSSELHTKKQLCQQHSSLHSSLQKPHESPVGREEILVKCVTKTA